MALTTNLLHTTPQTTSYMRNGMSTDIEGTQFPLQTGVPIQNNYMFKVIPASYSTSCISSSNGWQSGGQPLNQTNTGSGNNVISIALNPKNLLNYSIPYYSGSGILLDCERCPSITIGGGSLISTCTVTFTGFDYQGKAITYSQGLSGTVTTQVIFQPFSIITSVVFSPTFDAEGSAGEQTVSIGNSNVIGLPYYLPSTSYVASTTWAGAALATSTVTPGFNWRSNAVSVTSRPVRGYVTVPSNTNGTSLLTCCYYVSGSDSELNAELNNANQSSLKLAQVVQSTPAIAGVASSNVVPYLTEYDLTGVVYPSDNAFLYKYNLAKLS